MDRHSVNHDLLLKVELCCRKLTFIKASEDGAQELSFPEKKNDTKGRSFGHAKDKPTLLWQGSSGSKHLAAKQALLPSYNELKLGQFRERIISAFL
jgi:hypothetical protein